MNAKQRKARASLGGQAIVRTYGTEYMSKIGANGAQKFYTLYEWQPTGTSQFALVRKADHEIIAFSDGTPVTRRETEHVR